MSHGSWRTPAAPILSGRACHPNPPSPPPLRGVPPPIARRHAGTHSQRVANYYSRYTSHRFVVHRQRRLLFIVHHIAVPVTTRSYNTTTGRIRRAALFRIALQRYADVTNGTEGESARTRLYPSCSRTFVLARSFVRWRSRVYTRVCACQYTACTLVKIQSEHESRHGDVYCALVRCFIGVTLRDSFQHTPSPSCASFNNAHYDNIPLWPRARRAGGWSGGRGVGVSTAVLIFIYIRSTSGS